MATLTGIPRAALRDLVGGIAQIDEVIWDGESVPTLGVGGSWATLNITAYRGKGTDETREDFDAPKDQVSTTINGVRLFTLTIRVDSYSFDTPAYETLETIRRRLRGGSARTLMQQEGLALVDIQPITDLNVIADNRPVFASVMDVRFSIAVSEADPGFTGDYVAETTIAGSLTDGQHTYPANADVPKGT